MKKMLLLAALIASVLAYFSLTHVNTIDNSYSYYILAGKGWPFEYQQAESGASILPNSSLCNALNADGTPATDCHANISSNNHFAMAGDITLCCLIGLAISYGALRLYRLRR